MALVGPAIVSCGSGFGPPI